MPGSKKPRKKGLYIYLSPSEYDRVMQDKSNTTCRSVSEYARIKMLDKPLTVCYRDRSYDDFTEAYISFKRDLDGILKNGSITPAEKDWLLGQIITIKDVVEKLYDHVCENKTNEKPI